MVDVYDKERLISSIQDVPMKVLNEMSLTDTDESIEKYEPAISFAVSLLSQQELELLFFRYFQGGSYKTLKSTLRIGSTKTVFKRLKRLEEIIKQYVFYYEEQNYESDIKFIEDNLSSTHRKVAELLFKRYSYNRIIKEKIFNIGRNRLVNMGNEIKTLLYNSNRSLFWEVIMLVSRVKNYKKI